MTHALTLLLADDHPLVLRGLADLLSSDKKLRVLASCRDGRAAFHAAKEHEPDVAIVEANIPELDGLGFLNAVQTAGLPTRVILLTAEPGDSEIFDAVTGGVSGLIPRDAAPDTLLECIHEVGAGGRWLPAEIVDSAVAREAERREKRYELWKSLTAREQQIAMLAAENLSNKQVARRLDIAEGTVKIHLNHIYSKLRLTQRGSLVALVRHLFD